MFGIKSRFSRSLKRFLGYYTFFNTDLSSSLMRHFQADDYGHRANTEKGDLGYGWIHYGLIRSQKPENILCIGSRHGYIPAVLAQAARDNGFDHVYFVDAGFDGDENGWTGVGYWQQEAGQKAFQRFSSHSGLHEHISLHVMTTKEFAKMYPELYFDYIYVDGDHSYKGVAFDFKTFFPRLRARGFFAFHDITIKEPKPEGIYGVHKLWSEIKKKQKFVFEFPFTDSGLGIIQKVK